MDIRPGLKYLRFTMMIQNQIEAKLRVAFTPVHLEVINESSKHQVAEGSESHFKVVMVTSEFREKGLVDRHREVYQILDRELKEFVHALALHLYSLEEWEKAKAPESPPCV
jgi:BolA family transcriptional regulator, general stress-responsive regulator